METGGKKCPTFPLKNEKAHTSVSKFKIVEGFLGPRGINARGVGWGKVMDPSP